MSATIRAHRIVRAGRRSNARGVVLRGTFTQADLQGLRDEARAILVAAGESPRGKGYVVFDPKPDSATIWFK